MYLASRDAELKPSLNLRKRERRKFNYDLFDFFVLFLPRIDWLVMVIRTTLTTSLAVVDGNYSR